MHDSLGNLLRQAGAGLRALLVLTLLTGVLYPLAVTGVAQGLFPDRANGSHLTADGEVVGSELIGQRYSLPPENPDDPDEAPRPDPLWFQPRPSAGIGTNSVNGQYALLLSGATNLSAYSADLTAAVRAARAEVIAFNSTPDHRVRAAEVPADAVTSSGSGLDPHISPEYARLQTHRVAERHGLPPAEVAALVEQHTDGRTLGFVGEPRVNVLALNVALRELGEEE